jgi:hypothetical protein
MEIHHKVVMVVLVQLLVYLDLLLKKVEAVVQEHIILVKMVEKVGLVVVLMVVLQDQT